MVSCWRHRILLASCSYLVDILFVFLLTFSSLVCYNSMLNLRLACVIDLVVTSLAIAFTPTVLIAQRYINSIIVCCCIPSHLFHLRPFFVSPSYYYDNSPIPDPGVTYIMAGSSSPSPLHYVRFVPFSLSRKDSTHFSHCQFALNTNYCNYCP